MGTNSILALTVVPKPVGPSGATTSSFPILQTGTSFGGPGISPSVLNK